MVSVLVRIYYTLEFDLYMVTLTVHSLILNIKLIQS